MGKFTVQQMKAGYKFNLKAGNGQIIASSELYHVAEECLAAIERVRRHAGAAVEDQTLPAPQPLPFPKFTVRHSERGSIPGAGLCAIIPGGGRGTERSVGVPDFQVRETTRT